MCNSRPAIHAKTKGNIAPTEKNQREGQEYNSARSDLRNLSTPRTHLSSTFMSIIVFIMQNRYRVNDRHPLCSGNLQHTKDITACLVGLHVGPGALLVRVHDHLAPVFRHCAAGGGTAGLGRVVGHGELGVSFFWRCGCRGGFGRLEGCLGLEVWLWLEGPDVDDGAVD